MKWLTDDVVGHLRQVAAWPDVSGTKYAVIEEIGRGGMGTVYRAVDTTLGRDVALKVINAAGDHAALASRLALEARVLARLDHPGVVPIHDSGILADGRAFYVMKLVRGEVLDEFLSREDDANSANGNTNAAASLDQRLRIFERIAEPIAFAHAHGIVHRDLKPHNVMIGPFGEVLVMDWGAARLVDAQAHAHAQEEPEPVMIIGTPGYMSPEQASGARDVDARADVYALGALLQQMLAHLPNLSKRLRAICAKAMATHPDDRYADAAALADDVARFRANAPVLACPETWIDRAARFYTTYHTAILLVLAYLVMRVIVAFFWRR